MFESILFAHILIAVGMMVVAIMSWIAVARRHRERVGFFLDLFVLGLTGEIVSGSILAFLSPQTSILHFCVNIGLYLFLSVVVLLPSHMFLGVTFPWPRVIVRMIPSLSIAVVTASLLIVYA